MYYIDQQQIEDRLQFLPYLIEACKQLQEKWYETDVLLVLAQERLLHLAIEIVTDVGSLLIDGFLMRDASSYEDIVEIMIGEHVVSAELHQPLIILVKLRKSLVLDYMRLDRVTMHPLLPSLPNVLQQWSESVRTYMANHIK